MGDFDRVDNSSKKTETKKLVMVLVLAVVFIGLLAYEGTRGGGGPQTAGASTVGDSSAAPIVIEESPDQVRLALQKDPTSSLLLSGAQNDQDFSKVPRNPFQMSAEWRVSLTKAAPPPVIAVTTAPAPKSIFQPVAIPVRIEDYKVNMILRQNDQLIAVINGKTVSAGSIVDKARVLEIHEDSVTLQHVDFPSGPVTSLKIGTRTPVGN